MSAPPAQNVAKPSPVPGPSTVTASPPPDSSSASSPTRMLIGSTVDDPVTNTSPLGELDLAAGRRVLAPPCPSARSPSGAAVVSAPSAAVGLGAASGRGRRAAPASVVAVLVVVAAARGEDEDPASATAVHGAGVEVFTLSKLHSFTPSDRGSRSVHELRRGR